MVPNYSLSPLPFYDSLSKQNHRRDYAFGRLFNLFTPDKQVLPFQIIRTHRIGALVSSVSLVSLDSGTSTDITSEMAATELFIRQFSDYDIIRYTGRQDMAITTPEGQYYLELNDGYETFYSEVFTIVNDISNYLKIEYFDLESMLFDDGMVDFTTDFKFNIYLPSQLSRPDYTFTEEVKDRDGFTFPEKQISEKTFKFVFLASEYLLDALRIVRMMDYITITNRSDVYNAETFLISPEWEDGGFFASVEAEFQCNTVVKKIGKMFSIDGIDPVIPDNVILTHDGEIIYTQESIAILYK